MTAGPQQDVGDQARHGALAVRAGDRHDRDRRSASRTHSGGVARAATIRSVQRARRRSWAPVRRAVRDGDTSRSASASAASVRVTARSAPFHGNVTIQCPGSDERWTREAAPTLGVVDAQAPDPADHCGHRVRPLAGGDVGAQVDERMPAGVALAVPGSAPADGDLELDHRLEPVDIRALEQAGLDQTHGPGRIASAPAARLRPMNATSATPPLPSTAELDAPARRHECRPASLPRRPRAISSTSIAGATRPTA